MADEDKDKKPVTESVQQPATVPTYNRPFVQKVEHQPAVSVPTNATAPQGEPKLESTWGVYNGKDNPTLIPVNVASKPALKPDEDPGVKSLGNQIKMLHEMANRYVPEDDATRRRRERAENARRITANVGDGLAALANLVGATKGAPVVQSATMASKVEQRLAELRQEREANEQKFLNYSLKENELINQRAATVRQLEAEKAAKDRQAKEDEWTEKERAQKERLWESEFQEALAKATAAEFTAVYKQLQAEYAGKLSQAKIDEIASRIYKNMHAGSGTSKPKQDSQRKYKYNADGKIESITVTHGNNSGSQGDDQNNGNNGGGSGNNNGGKSDNNNQQQGQQPGLTGKPLGGKSVASTKI